MDDAFYDASLPDTVLLPLCALPDGAYYGGSESYLVPSKLPTNNDVYLSPGTCSKDVAICPWLRVGDDDYRENCYSHNIARAHSIFFYPPLQVYRKS